jgi:hypothetical protein
MAWLCSKELPALLHMVQMSRCHGDCKSFVDMPLNTTTTLSSLASAWAALTAQGSGPVGPQQRAQAGNSASSSVTSQQGSRAPTLDICAFVERYFLPPGQWVLKFKSVTLHHVCAWLWPRSLIGLNLLPPRPQGP